MRRNEDPTKPRQRWYCVDCGCTYKVKYGTIVELRHNHNVYLAKASIPYETMKDLKAAVVEATAYGTSLDTPQKLFMSFPALKPMAANGSNEAFFHQAKLGETSPDRQYKGTATSQDQLTGCYRFNSCDYNELPEIAWLSILTLFSSQGRGAELLHSLEGLVTQQEGA